MTPRFFTTLASYQELERPDMASTDQVFVVLKGCPWPLTRANVGVNR